MKRKIERPACPVATSTAMIGGIDLWEHYELREKDN